jgi:acyl-CoA reductase-like NAD-dependent aldehyde dehydrogenase
MEPTVISHVSNEWRIAREEIFGPVMVAIPWKEEEEAIRMAMKVTTDWLLSSGHDIGRYSHSPRHRIRLDSDQPGCGDRARAILWRV